MSKCFRQPVYVQENCWVCDKKPVNGSGFCLKHKKEKELMLKKLKKRGDYVSLMDGWSYTALKDQLGKPEWCRQKSIDMIKNEVRKLDLPIQRKGKLCLNCKNFAPVDHRGAFCSNKCYDEYRLKNGKRVLNK